MAADKLMHDLVEFYGTECHFCNVMQPLLEKLHNEEGLKVQKVECWHNEDNARLFEETDQGRCGGVPFFLNRKTGKWICGATNYEKFKAWALGK
ncbi:MAG TPA: thioredoxin domain-containing protein [archaeon]|nr:thioredoxin domain-containing protein [archaeon]